MFTVESDGAILAQYTDKQEAVDYATACIRSGF